MFPNVPTNLKHGQKTSSVDHRQLRILFHPNEARRHVSASIGLAQRLQSLGHEIIFLVDFSLRQQFAPYGFIERYVHKVSAKKADDHEPSEHLAQKLQNAGILSNLAPLKKLERWVQRGMLDPIFRSCDDYDSQVKANLAIERPDLIIVDNLFIEPAILQSRIPMVSVYSGNPLPLYQTDRLPPFGLGLPSNQLEPEVYRQVKQIFFEPVKKLESRLLGKKTDRQTITSEESLMYMSKHLIIYGYPLELDYHDTVPPPDNFHRLDILSQSKPEQNFKLPEKFGKRKEGKLIYVTFGSIGTMDKTMMRRVLDLLGATSHEYIVSMQNNTMALPENMFAIDSVPQIEVLPLVDLVVCHGGNNTITETIAAGKACLVLPFFADGYDNAQRVHEKGLGARLDPYKCTAEQLVDTIHRLLADEAMKTRLEAIADTIERQSASLFQQLSNRLIEIVQNNSN